MKRTILAALIALLAPIGQSNGGILEDFSVAVVYLRQEFIQTTDVEGTRFELWLKTQGKDEFKPYTGTHSGSGVLISLNNHPYLVTAEHVAKDMSPTAVAVVRGAEDSPVALSLSDLVGNATNLNWVVHATADVAVLPLFPKTKEIEKKLEKHFFSEGALEPYEIAPSRDTILTTLGFPLNLGVGQRFSPISKESRPASGLLTLQRGDTKAPATFFLLQDPTIGGFSGAVVLDLPGIKIKGNTMVGQLGARCYGIMHGTIKDDTGGKLAAVTPAIFVLETLRKAEQEVWGKKEK